MSNNMLTVCPFFGNKMSIKIYCCFFFLLLYRYYISKGAIVDQLGGDLNSTPLHWATRWGSLGIFLCAFLNLVSATDWFIQLLYFMGILAQEWTQSLMTGNAVNVVCLSYKSFQHLVWFLSYLFLLQRNFAVTGK